MKNEINPIADPEKTLSKKNGHQEANGIKAENSGQGLDMAASNEQPPITPHEAYFQSHPEVNSLYATSDGFLFLVKGHAEIHARSLTDAQVVTHKKP